MARARARLESRTQAETVRRAREEFGIMAVKMNSRDWPDFQFMLVGGRPFFIEFKQEGGRGRLSAGQQLMIYRLLRDGYDVEVHDDVEAALASIQARRAIGEARRRSLPSKAGMAAVARYISPVDRRLFVDHG